MSTRPNLAARASLEDEPYSTASLTSIWLRVAVWRRTC